MIKYIYILLALVTVSACVKRPVPETTSNTGEINLVIDNVAGNELLALDKWYTIQNGDSLKVDMFVYYVSNIKLTGEGGTEYIQPESYFLVNEAKPQSKKIAIQDIPSGKYNTITFLIGVDSARNVSGAQTGALDPVHGMFWDWETGYIMAKLEGQSPKSNIDGRVFYHFGQFSGKYNSIRQVTIPLMQDIVVSQKSMSEIHIKGDMLEWFKSPNTINLAETPMLMGGEHMKMMADNYADMFTLDHVEQ